MVTTEPPGSIPELEIHSPERSQDGGEAGTAVWGECAQAASNARKESRTESVGDMTAPVDRTGPISPPARGGAQAREGRCSPAGLVDGAQWSLYSLNALEV